MMGRHLTYFVSDVHLGLDVKDPSAREARFVAFLKGIPAEETEALYLLGDIWDFWYEYKDVVPKGYVRVFAALTDLMDAGVQVYFFQGNHDVWTYHYFEELGMVRLTQPHVASVGGLTLCLGHGDGLGPVPRGYKALRAIFHCRFLQVLFSSLHPRIAFAFGNGWSRHNRLARGEEYVFKGASEPLWKFCEAFQTSYSAAADSRRIDAFIFGHYHCQVDTPLPSGARLLMLRDWMDGANALRLDAADGSFTWLSS